MSASMNGAAAPADAKAQRKADEASAWQEYLAEREAVIKRTAELKELRLAAAAKAERVEKQAKRRAKAKKAAASPG